MSTLAKIWRAFFEQRPRDKYRSPVDDLRERDDVTVIGDRVYVGMTKAGYVDGKHFTALMPLAKQLKREGKLEEAEALLLRLVDANEAEAKQMKWGVAPAYYRELAIIYRKQKRYDDEVSILNRYFSKPLAPGRGPNALAERLKKAILLRDRNAVSP